VRVAEHLAATGFPVDLLTVRSDQDIAKLRRTHDIYVAEADHEPAGYLAWADQAPGVALVSALMIDPELQHFGIATRLLRELGEKAHRHGIEVVVHPCWDADKATIALLAKRGFMPENAGKAPEKILAWREQGGDEHVQEGQKLWWAKTEGLGLIPGLPRPEPE
jgi:amino-acid N-acetyltransferase